MKNSLLYLLLSCLMPAIGAHAQWCVPTSIIPYNANMPGITHVVLNNIDRTSTDLENYPNNSYVNTGLSTTLTPGQTYSISITYTIDAQICPDMNIRVWIDYNQDYQLDDVGETVVSANNQLPGTLTSTFTVPLSVTPGNTRMRITAKMSPNGGHSMPTPCDIPADPLGYHGEIEDYDIVLASTTGINNLLNQSTFNSFVSGENIHFTFSTQQNSIAELKFMNMQGKLISEVLPQQSVIPGTYQFELNANDKGINRGIYLAVLIIDNKKQIVRITLP